MTIASENRKTATHRRPDFLADLEKELAKLANQQVEEGPAQRLLALKFNKQRAGVYIIQRTHFVENRRQCWAQVQSSAPMSVKPIIWDHEREELEGDAEQGKPNHYVMSQQEGNAVGLTAADFENTPPSDGCLTCSYAWLHLAKNSDWMIALGASAALELSNSDEILKNGSWSGRIAVKMRDEVGIAFDKQPSNIEHMVADVEHANMLMHIAEGHAKSQQDCDRILDGARKSWAIDRVWKAHLVDLLSAIPG